MAVPQQNLQTGGEGMGATGGAASGAGQGAMMGAGFGPWGALIGAGIGLAKGHQDQQQEARQRKYAAEVIRNSPWSKMSPEAAMATVQPADQWGSLMQGAAGGAAVGQSFQKSQAEENMMKNYPQYYAQGMAQRGG